MAMAQSEWACIWRRTGEGQLGCCLGSKVWPFHDGFALRNQAYQLRQPEHTFVVSNVDTY